MQIKILAAPALAAALLLCASAVSAHHDGTNHAEGEVPTADGAQTPVATLGDLAVFEPWSRATPPMANVAAGYLTVRNAGTAPARLLGASSPRAERVEMHSMSLENDVMRMRELPDGIAVPGGGEIAFAPGGYHLMLIGLDAPLTEGERVPLTLRFEGGTIDVELAVGALGATGGAAGHGGH